MKKRMIALFMCACMLLTAPVLVGAADPEALPEAAQTAAPESPAPAPVPTEPEEPAPQADNGQEPTKPAPTEPTEPTEPTTVPTAPVLEFAEQTLVAYASDGANVTIAGSLPLGAQAKIVPVVLGYEQLAAYIGEEAAKAVGQYVAYDISILLPDGTNYEPDGNVSVVIGQPAIDTSEDVTVNHVEENDAGAPVAVTEVAAQTSGDTIAFETDGFSLYIFTVDFHYGDITYSIQGEGSILLSELFTQLGINKDAKTAAAVTFSDEALVSVAQQADGDWLLTSLMAFTTEEKLTVSFADGEELVLRVTDNQHQDTDDAVKTGETGEWWEVKTRHYQIFGTMWPTIDAGYSEYGGYYPAYCYLYDENENLISRSNLGGQAAAIGVCYSFKSDTYWFEVFSHDRLGNINYPDSLNQIRLGTPAVSGERYFRVKLHNLLTYSDPNYCSVTQESVISISKGNLDPNVKRKVFIYVDGVLISAEEYLFPGRTDCNVNRIDVTYDGSKYVMTKSEANASGAKVTNGDHYRVDLTTITYTATAQGSTGIASTGGTGTYKAGAPVSFTAAVQPGYDFDGWYDAAGNKVSGDLTYNFNMPGSDVTYTAKANLKTFTLTTSAENATVTDGFSYNYSATEKIIVSFAPIANYRIESVTVDGTALSEAGIAKGTVELDRLGNHSVDVKAVPAIAAYTVNYYKDSVSEANKLGTAAGSGQIGSVITVSAGAVEGELDWKKPAHYLSGVQQGSATVAGDGSTVVNVLYLKDENDTKTLSYTVRYMVNGTAKDTYTVSKTVWAGEPNTLNIENITVKAYPGFKYTDNTANLVRNGDVLTGAGTIANGGTITLNYAPVESSVQVFMHVSGKLANLEHEFTGKATATVYEAVEGSVNELSYSLKNGMSSDAITVKAGNELSLSDLEELDGYTLTVKYKLPDGTETAFNAADSIALPEGALEIHVYYERADEVPTTGIFDGHMGASLALLGTMGALTAAYIFLSAKRRRDEY